MRSGWLLLLLASPAVSQAQKPSSGPALAVTGAFFALSVADLDVSARWYSEKLGLEVVMRVPGGNLPSVVVLEGGGLIVELIHHAEGKPLSEAAPRSPTRSGSMGSPRWE